jgi:hypothetical protein
MKRLSLLLCVVLLHYSSLASNDPVVTPAVTLRIIPSTTSKAFCPSQDVIYAVINDSGGNPPQNCIYTWTIEGGTFQTQPSGQNKTQVTVRWKDEPGQGTLTVTTSGCENPFESGSTTTAKNVRMLRLNRDSDWYMPKHGYHAEVATKIVYVKEMSADQAWQVIFPMMERVK